MLSFRAGRRPRQVKPVYSKQARLKECVASQMCSQDNTGAFTTQNQKVQLKNLFNRFSVTLNESKLLHILQEFQNKRPSAYDGCEKSL